MKNTLKYAIVLCLLFAFTGLQGQIKFGAKAGLNLSTMSLKYGGISLSPKTLIGFNVGVISDISLGKSLSLQPGIFFSTKGSKFKVGAGTETYEMTWAPTYIEVPVNVLYNIDLSVTKLFIYAGPYFAYGIGGKIKETGYGSYDISYGSGTDDDQKPFDIGVNVGAGVNLSGFLISLQYGLGIANLAPSKENEADLKNRTFSISVGYLF